MSDVVDLRRYCHAPDSADSPDSGYGAWRRYMSASCRYEKPKMLHAWVRLTHGGHRLDGQTCRRCGHKATPAEDEELNAMRASVPAS